MREMTPDQMRAAIDRWLASVPTLLERVARKAAVRIGGRSVGQFMQDAKGGPRRRPKGLSGPLRILSGTLAKAAAQDKDGVVGAVNEVKREGWIVTLVKGVDLGVVPYARIHEKGGTAGRGASIPARPYLFPAVKAEAPGIRLDAARTLTGSLRDAVGGMSLGTA